MSYKVTYTAEDEEPDCMMCDHVCGWVWKDYKGKFHDNCAEHCGAEHGWNGYKRTEEVSEWNINIGMKETAELQMISPVL